MQTASGTREARQLAREVKFLVHRELAQEIRDWAGRHMTPDVHGGGPNGDEYRVTTLYCDSDTLDVFHRNRSFGRAKYRIRRYGHMSDVFLERKLRTNRLLAKRRTLVSLGELDLLRAGWSPIGWAGGWFEDRVRFRGLRPTCQVAYRRTARVADVRGRLMRLTVDDDLRAIGATEFAFRDDRGAQMLLQHVIVELKFAGDLPLLFQLLTERFQMQAGPISKYRLALSTLRGLATGREVLEATATGTDRAASRDTLTEPCSTLRTVTPGRGVLTPS
jgi:hypothetical protein